MYTERETKQMIDAYTANPCIEVVDKLSVQLNKPRRSIISKLVKEGVYITRGYRTKTGDIPITKLQVVRSIEEALDISLPGLDKAPKSTLKTLETAVLEQTQFLDDVLEELQDKQTIEKLRYE